MAIDPHHPDISAQVEMFPQDNVGNTNARSRVFVTQGTDLDLIKATRFGELTNLVAQKVNVVTNPTEVVNTLYEVLQDYTPNDYLLPTGDPIIIGLAFTVAAEIGLGHLRILKWDRQLNDYYSVYINLNDN